jgi:cell division septal protein FtsQ
MLCWLVIEFIIHYLIWFFISVVEVSGNDNVSVSDIEDEIDMSLASQGIATGLEVASNPKYENVWQTSVSQLQ